MPPLPTVEGVAKFFVQQNDGTKNLENVFYIQKGIAGATGAWTSTDINTVCEDLCSSWEARVLPQQSADLTITGATGVALDGTETIGEYTLSTPISGGSGGNPFVAGTSVVWSWPVPAAYRGGHFRTYVGGQTDVFASTVQQMTTAGAENWASRAANFSSDINAITLGDFPLYHVCVSYYRAKELRIPPVVYIPGIPTVDLRYGSQRRRMGKLGARYQ